MCSGICSRKCASRPAGSHVCAISDVTLSMLVTCMCHHSIGTLSMAGRACAITWLWRFAFWSPACVITVLGHQTWWITCVYYHMIVTLLILITCMCHHHSIGTPNMVDHVRVPSHDCDTSHDDHLPVSSQYWDTKHDGSCVCTITWLWHFVWWSPACVITVLGHQAWWIMCKCQHNCDTQSLQ
jgi:hypothetical protein